MRCQPAADHWPQRGRDFARTLDWSDVLAQQQAIYEELLASPDWAGQRERRLSPPKQRPLSGRELSRDLVGWSPPQPG